MDKLTIITIHIIFYPFWLLYEQNNWFLSTAIQLDFLLTGVNSLILAWTQKLGAERTIKRNQEIKQTGAREDVDTSDARNYVPKTRNPEREVCGRVFCPFLVSFTAPTKTKWSLWQEERRECFVYGFFTRSHFPVAQLVDTDCCTFVAGLGTIGIRCWWNSMQQSILTTLDVVTR